MSRKAAGLAGAGALLAGAAFFGYRALGRWLVASMAGKLAAPLAGAAQPAGAFPPAAPPSLSALPKAARSGLDLILKTSAPPASGAPAMTPEQRQAIRQAGLTLVDSLRPLLQDPAFTSRLTPPQSKQYSQLMALLGQAESAARGRGPIDVKKMAAEVQKAQQLSLNLMSQTPAQPQRGEEPR